jgi:hypothetical protein
LFRLNQVMRRIRLAPLPEQTAQVLQAGRRIVADRQRDLLPPDEFDWPGPGNADSDPPSSTA